MEINLAFDLPVYLTKLREGPQQSLQLVMGSEEGDAGLCSLVSSERMHGNDSKLHQGRFSLDIGKHLFTKSVAKHWNRLPREVIDVPSPPILRDVCTIPLIA